MKVLHRVEDLIICQIIGRSSRFSVLVNIEGTKEYVHLNNTGRLKDLLIYGKTGFCIPIKGSKFRYRLIAVEDYGYAAIIDTTLQERLFVNAVFTNLIPWLNNIKAIKHNVRIEDSVIDYMFNKDNEQILVEVKSAVLRLNQIFAGYPDAPTVRGRKQIELLGRYCAKGNKAYVVFIAGLPNVKGFKLYCEADRKINVAISKAKLMGVEFKSLSMFLNSLTRDIILDNSDLPVYLDC